MGVCNSLLRGLYFGWIRHCFQFSFSPIRTFRLLLFGKKFRFHIMYEHPFLSLRTFISEIIILLRTVKMNFKCRPEMVEARGSILTLLVVCAQSAVLT